MDARESAVKDEGESKGDASESSHNKFHDLPVRQTSRPKENIYPYCPQAQDLRDIDHLLQGNPHSLTPSKDSPMQRTHQHNHRSFINYQPTQLPFQEPMNPIHHLQQIWPSI